MNRNCMAILVFAFLADPIGVSALTFVDTSDEDFRLIGPIGEPNTATFGQTFTLTGPDSNLEHFSFRFNDSINPDFVDFAAYIYAWDGSKAVGPQLFSSPALSSTNNHGSGGLEQFEFSTGGLPLLFGSQYVAFISASNYFDGARGTSRWEYSDYDVYSGGSAAWHNNGGDFSKLTSEPWSSTAPGNMGGNAGGFDLWFIARFTSVPVDVPVPSSLALFGLGLAGITLFRRHCTCGKTVQSGRH